MTPFSVSSAGEHAIGRLARCDGEARREQRVGGLVGAEQRQPHVVDLAGVADAHALREAVGGQLLQPQRLAGLADAS